MASIEESSTDDDSYDGYIRTDALEDIRYGNSVHTYINARYSRLKIHDQIRKTKSECNGAELPAKRIGKGLHKVFKAAV